MVPSYTMYPTLAAADSQLAKGNTHQQWRNLIASIKNYQILAEQVEQCVHPSKETLSNIHATQCFYLSKGISQKDTSPSETSLSECSQYMVTQGADTWIQRSPLKKASIPVGSAHHLET